MVFTLTRSTLNNPIARRELALFFMDPLSRCTAADRVRSRLQGVVNACIKLEVLPAAPVLSTRMKVPCFPAPMDHPPQPFSPPHLDLTSRSWRICSPFKMGRMAWRKQKNETELGEQMPAAVAARGPPATGAESPLPFVTPSNAAHARTGRHGTCKFVEVERASSLGAYL